MPPRHPGPAAGAAGDVPHLLHTGMHRRRSMPAGSITSTSGNTSGRPTSTTWCRSANSITTSSTKAAGPSPCTPDDASPCTAPTAPSASTVSPPTASPHRPSRPTPHAADLAGTGTAVVSTEAAAAHDGRRSRRGAPTRPPRDPRQRTMNSPGRQIGAVTLKREMVDKPPFRASRRSGCAAPQRPGLVVAPAFAGLEHQR